MVVDNDVKRQLEKYYRRVRIGEWEIANGYRGMAKGDITALNRRRDAMNAKKHDVLDTSVIQGG